jgi:hypothetical protein
MPIIAPNHFAAVLMMYAALPNEDTRNPHVVLLAGLLFDAEIWRDVCALLECRAGVSFLSFPNFSSIESMATHVLQSIDRLRAGRCRSFPPVHALSQSSNFLRGI